MAVFLRSKTRAYSARPHADAAALCSAATGLVDRLEASGTWPSPDLVDSVVGQGNRAMPALAAYIRGALMSLRDRDALPVAIRLVGVISGRNGVPMLASLLRECSGEVADAAAEALMDAVPDAALVCMTVAADERLPLSTRVSALNAACDSVADRPPAERAPVCDRLHRMLLTELCRGEALSRTNRQWTAALVEALASLSFIPARPAIDAAYDRGIVSRCDLAYDAVEELYSGASGRRTPRGSFLCRYRRDYKLRSLRMSSLLRARAEP